MFEGNSIIKASAGTGKTYALATRFIRLMLLDGEDPAKIVALTFSRAAAQEIYTKILDRLGRAATDTDGEGRFVGNAFADEEWGHLLEDFEKGLVPGGAEKYRAIRANPPPHAVEDFRRLLRRLVDTQHLGAIATLDSFILRIVKNFPKEMGFQNAVSVLDPVDETAAIDEAVRRTLGKTDGSSAGIATAFSVATGGDYSRTCLRTIEGILAQQGWRSFVMANPACRDWTVESMCAALGVTMKGECPDLGAVDTGGACNPARKFVEYVRGYDATKDIFPGEGSVKKMMQALWRDRSATDYGWTTDGGIIRHFEYGEAGAAAIRAATKYMMDLFLERQLEIVRAKIDLVLAVEEEYGRMTRRAGRLTFDDFTRYSAEERFSERGIAIQNVEFRFDSKFNHWALDEFQDTSELQWRCLRELVENAAGDGRTDGSRTAMAVGDMKQSIYTWRGASARPFEDIASWPAFEGCGRDLKDSHRYGPEITAFINLVFGHGNIRADGIIPEACSEAVEAWRRGWIDHVSREPQDYVKVVVAGKDDDDERDDEILPALYRELSAFWRRHEERESTDTVGVLVRNNDNGLEVAEYLRGKGLPVVWEGMNPAGDVPVVQAVLALLKLADHPEDTAAWKTASELMDIRSVLMPDCRSATFASQLVSRDLSKKGLSRTLKEYCGKLRDSGRLPPDGLSSEKLCQLVELGVDFENRESGNGRVDAFLQFAGQSCKRELAASSDVIRILTIHRSKGLGFDHVFVPLFEHDRKKSAMDFPKSKSPLFDRSGWVLSHLSGGVAEFNPHTDAAYRKARSERFAESLRTYYVALTRAKRSMYVIFPEDDEKKKPAGDTANQNGGLLMRDLIVNALSGEMPYERGVPPEMKRAVSNGPAHDPWPVTGVRETVARLSPSRGLHAEVGSQSAGSLFNEDFGSAARHGIEVHAGYQEIEWACGDGLAAFPEAFRCAFERKDDSDSVWREKTYELFMDGRWETGQFDRVVFSGAGDERTAVIYDFKTNAVRSGESPSDFADRMKDAYSGQMLAYRRALSRLTGIDESRIGMKLLLESTGGAVDVG